MIKTTDYELPSYWASALINDDWSGLEDDEIRHINDVLGWLGLKAHFCLYVADDQEFRRSPSYYPANYGLLDGDYSTFTFQLK